MSPPTQDGGDTGNGLIHHNRLALKSGGFGSGGRPAATVSVPGSFGVPARPGLARPGHGRMGPGPRPLGPAQEQLTHNFASGPVRKRQTVVDVTPLEGTAAQIEELEEDKEEAAVPAAPPSNHPRPHQSHRGTQAGSQASSQSVPPNHHSFRRPPTNPAQRPANQSQSFGSLAAELPIFEDSPPEFDTVHHGSRGIHGRPGQRTNEKPQQQPPPHQFLDDDGGYSFADMHDFAAADFNNSHDDGHRLGPSDALDEPAFSDSSEAVYHMAHSGSRMGAPLAERHVVRESPLTYNTSYAPQQRNFAKTQAQPRQPNQPRPDGQPTRRMPTRARGAPPAAPQQAQVQVQLFSGDTFATAMSPLADMDITQLWRRAYAQSKERRAQPGYNIFNVLNELSANMSNQVREIESFIREIDEKHASVKATVDKSVRAVEYRTTLYEKAREESTRVSRNAKTWEAKRPRE